MKNRLLEELVKCVIIEYFDFWRKDHQMSSWFDLDDLKGLVSWSSLKRTLKNNLIH